MHLAEPIRPMFAHGRQLRRNERQPGGAGAQQVRGGWVVHGDPAGGPQCRATDSFRAGGGQSAGCLVEVEVDAVYPVPGAQS
ncbi:hypothetical protein ABZ942_10365 [Nocardia sp. NPDC046473]|uniref:hypothetical protein n=1 Tax=Nocardia sp. NPDC046473 TaxID=3155733 RepID=UPI0033E5FA2C